MSRPAGVTGIQRVETRAAANHPAPGGPIARSHLAQSAIGTGVEKPWVNSHAGNGILTFTMEKKNDKAKTEEKNTNQKEKNKKQKNKTQRNKYLGNE